MVAVVVLAAGFGLAIATGWITGEVAQRLEGPLDVPVFDWYAARQQGGAWQQGWLLLTQMGNRRQTQTVVIVGAIALTVGLAIAGGRRRWVPLVVLPTAYLMEKYGQVILAQAVDRGHPPTTLGTWPSGGVARLLVAYGLVLVLVLVVTEASARTWGLAGTGLLALAVIEAYSRTYLLKHWFTDVLGGFVVGGLILVTMTIVINILYAQPSGKRQSTAESMLAR